MSFQIASDDSIKQGRITDVYFERVNKALEGRGINPQVSMEVRASSLPGDWQWAVFAGLEEVLELAQGLPVSIRALDEGEIFEAGEPVLSISGNYLDFGVYETAILGLICQASGIATNAARCKHAAGERMVISFGARRMHPALAPMIERNAFVGGCDGVAVVESAVRIGEEPSGTMSHTLILCAGDERVAFEAFDESMEPGVKRVALVDTFQDEKFGALFAAEVLGEKLFAVRLDTPGSRRGDFLQIMEEVRWELDIRGFEDVKLFVSGGIDEYKILAYNSCADAYGVGTHISNSPVVNYSMDIVEIEGVPMAKRGKKSGLKQLWSCPSCGARRQTLASSEKLECPACAVGMKALLAEKYARGKRLSGDPAPRQIRSRVLERLGTVRL
ncbi:MAG: nicotinate phosphoribosyltransferase [Actinobacteria bacterium]|nr:nicotinate phosphoribosyltransferase [Actinomycetota bacterium]MBU4240152.1 nicotinate phosphoribosyltransferase [Actinomycetota bacterium]MBU4302708.1 nicotinate phosphoribosyltransferase [Actinomycetota bacterium]MBU4489188.1 nicotinate phosphoribosyltransferase [Actinomycetota bacterium]MCG2796555.1 nicotinate phosphoribosyltransferase [Actinomycetes bacterium]